MQKIIIDQKEFLILDVKEKVTIADSFVVKSNKIGSGNGEAKLYVGNNNAELRSFFGKEPFIINCFLLKKDLEKYLNDTEIEYKNPEQQYHCKDLLPSLFLERKSSVSNINEEIIPFEAQEQSQIVGPRIYINSDDKSYKLLRELSLPNITYISILKIKELSTNKIFFYFKLFADFFGEIEHPAILAKVDNDILINPSTTTDGSQIIRARNGHGIYRKKLLTECPFCPITMISDDRLLIASHIKPWVVSNDFEKTDPKNGFMLSPTFDFLFDRGFISFADNKKIILSPFLSKMTYSLIGISDNKTYSMLPIEGRELYLQYHRKHILKYAGDVLI